MQEREKTRCKSDMAYHCATHDTQWLDDESDRCEYKRMVDAEAAIARVRDVTVPVPGDVYDLDSYTRGAADALALTNKALDGDA